MYRPVAGGAADMPGHDSLCSLLGLRARDAAAIAPSRMRDSGMSDQRRRWASQGRVRRIDEPFRSVSGSAVYVDCVCCLSTRDDDWAEFAMRSREPSANAVTP